VAGEEARRPEATAREERPPRPLGTPTDLLRPTGRIGPGTRIPLARPRVGRVLAILAIGLVALPLLVWLLILLVGAWAG
jgi:hypothetical protein